MAVDGWAVTFGTASRRLGEVANVTAHPSTASVPITVLLCTGLVRCSAVLPIKGGAVA